MIYRVASVAYTTHIAHPLGIGKVIGTLKVVPSAAMSDTRHQ